MIPELHIKCFYLKGEKWVEMAPEQGNGKETFSAEDDRVCVELVRTGNGWDYRMRAAVDFDTRVHLEAALDGEEEAYHVIPCTIFGDGNIDHVKPGELPSLTEKYPGMRLCAPCWELRADRAAVPVSMMSLGEVTAGISVAPYSEEGSGIEPQAAGRWVHNGVYASLPRTIGVSLGYRNRHCTFVDKGNAGESTWENVRSASAGGHIYLLTGQGRMDMHRIVRSEYERLHERPLYTKTLEEAGRAIVDACVCLNWNENWQAYTDMSCCPPEKTGLKAWRPVCEIGWTGIAELACPFIMAEKLLGLPKQTWGRAKDGWQLFDEIAGAYNEKSGLLNDLVRPIDESGSLVNGWWGWYGIARDCHCAYNNGKAVFELLKTISFLSERGEAYPERWLEVSQKVLDTICALQRGDGSYGYTYSNTQRRVLDWDGFAGCWFLPSMVYAYRLTGKEAYLASAEKAQQFYSGYVRALNCYGTPMDTWKAVDEEGNLAFVKGCRLLHETTGKEQYLSDLEAGALYEYLWRYAYKTRPENAPLKDGWNACGGSVTSISNPHIHPMGVLIDDDLCYLGEKTGDRYHLMRACDGTAWAMQNLELYPEKSGYGRYGITSERFCPSDGLVTERYSDGRPYSSWFTFNLWATANVLEALMDEIHRKRHLESNTGK